MRFRCGFVHMFGEQGVAAAVGGYHGRPEDEYASENTKRFTVDSLLQIRRPADDATIDKRANNAVYSCGKTFILLPIYFNNIFVIISF